jgi:hypothetical protein
MKSDTMPIVKKLLLVIVKNLTWTFWEVEKSEGNCELEILVRISLLFEPFLEGGVN